VPSIGWHGLSSWTAAHGLPSFLSPRRQPTSSPWAESAGGASSRSAGSTRSPSQRPSPWPGASARPFGAVQIRRRGGEAPAPSRHSQNSSKSASPRAAPLRPSTERDYRNVLSHDVLPVLGARPAKQVARDQVVDVINRIAARGGDTAGGPRTGGRAVHLRPRHRSWSRRGQSRDRTAQPPCLSVLRDHCGGRPHPHLVGGHRGRAGAHGTDDRVHCAPCLADWAKAG
jgi:hypothetical protein